MAVSRVFSRVSRTAFSHCRNRFFLSSPPQHHHSLPLLPNHFHSLSSSSNKTSVLHHEWVSTSIFQRFRFSTSASPEPSEKEHSGKDQGTTAENQDASADEREVGADDAKASEQTQDTEGALDDLSKEDLVKLVSEKEELLQKKHTDFTSMQDKSLRTIAEMENVMERIRRDAENSKKFAIQNFAKSLLDVADNLSRASSVVKESFNKVDESKDTVPLLKTLLEGVEMTEKQLSEVFKKYGVEKYDPTNEQFDPNRHNAVFQVPYNSKPPGTVAVVLKAGYMLHDRIIRPAEVGVTPEAEGNEASQES